jgi:hypothetical protein
MAYTWSWSWGSESAALLTSDMGFSFEITGATTNEPVTTEQYKPTGAPTKYSMACDIGRYIQLPVVAATGMSQGVVSVALKTTSTNYFAGTSLIRVEGTSARGIYVQMTTGGALKLYVDNTLKATAAVATDFITWKFLSLHFDMSADPWKGKVTVDGVELIAEFTDARAADTVTLVRLEGPVSADREWFNGQIIVQDAYADASPPRYVTRISPDADVSTVGTWTPTTGTNHASTGVDPFSTATDTTEPTPTIGDEVITNYTGDLTAKLGGVPGSVSLVTVHSYSTGAANTARAEVGDQAGTATTAGTTTLIGSDTTYAYASAPTKPSGGAWAATDTPKCKYEVVSV